MHDKQFGQLLLIDLVNKEKIYKRIRVADPVGSGVFACFGSGSGFQISLDPDPVSARILEQKKRVKKGL